MFSSSVLVALSYEQLDVSQLCIVSMHSCNSVEFVVSGCNLMSSA